MSLSKNTTSSALLWMEIVPVNENVEKREKRVVRERDFVQSSWSFPIEFRADFVFTWSLTMVIMTSKNMPSPDPRSEFQEGGNGMEKM